MLCKFNLVLALVNLAFLAWTARKLRRQATRASVLRILKSRDDR